MDAEIDVQGEGGGVYVVTVDEQGSRSSHRVTVKAAYADRLTGGRVSTEKLLQESFRFLLEREPKESILGSFELPVIGRYFPEYEGEITRRLGA